MKHTDQPGPDWLPLSEAARMLSVSIVTLRRRARRHWSPRGLARKTRHGMGAPVWWLHRSVDNKLTRFPKAKARSDRVREALLAKYSHEAVERSYRRNHYLQLWRKRIASGETSARAAFDVVREAKLLQWDVQVSERSLFSWWKAYNAIGRDGQIQAVAGLVDRHKASAGDGRSQEAVTYFYSLYHTQAEHTAKTCHEATLDKAAECGWGWPASYAATAKWLRRYDDKATSFLHRKGSRKYSQKFMDYIEVDRAAQQPGDWFEADHSQLDIWATDGQRQFRPWLTSIIDLRSRVVVGWRIGVSPHQDAIVAAMRMAFRDWAIPKHFHMDNGKDFTSELIVGYTKREQRRHRAELGPAWRDLLRERYDARWQGILGELKIKVSLARPYQPWGKGVIERSYGEFHEKFCKTFATYTGRSPEHRPDCSEKMRREYGEWVAGAKLKTIHEAEVPTLEQVRIEFADQLTIYHNTRHGGKDMNRLSPIAVWNTAESLRRAQDEELMCVMESRGIYTAGANGVRFKIGGKEWGYGARSGPLRRYKGRSVYITLDPDDCSRCYAYTEDKKRFVGTLEANEQIPYGTDVDELREVSAEINRRRKTMRQAQADAPRRMCNASQELRARRARRAAELRRTGTDDVKSIPEISPVRTGFEGVSRPAPTAPVELPSDAVLDPDVWRRMVEIETDDHKPQSPWGAMKDFVDREAVPVDEEAGDLRDLLMDDEELADMDSASSYDDDVESLFCDEGDNAAAMG